MSVIRSALIAALLVGWAVSLSGWKTRETPRFRPFELTQGVLAIGDCMTGFNGGTDFPQGAYWWQNIPELLQRNITVQHASWPGTALANWAGLTATVAHDLYYARTLDATYPLDVVMTMLGGHDVRLGVTEEDFDLAIERFHERVRTVSKAKAWVIVLQASPNAQQREALGPFFRLYERYCDDHEDVFCTVDLRDHFELWPNEFYGNTFHWNGPGHRRAAELIAPTLERALRYARRH